ncbi:MAG: nucleotidyl transferase AbiEii/AbiGii toxin family protein [Polyangiaceae bacterium]|nr:nucleotidyl transferase AbiEii/AbiGii toxin family protein [Polyangiaceae bacterium]
MSRHEPAFVLKGAILFTIWSGHPHRATKDIDLLGRGAPDLRRLEQIAREVCIVDVNDDGVTFDPNTVETTRIKEDADYEGVRVTFAATIGTAVVPLQVDIGFGDAVTPGLQVVDFPTLLPAPAPRLRIYPRETVIAEKLEAMVHCGMANSRMKDFFDIWFLACGFEFDGPLLASAIHATFERRQTRMPERDPVALTQEFKGVIETAVAGPSYSHVMLIDGNDERGIDVGIMTRAGRARATAVRRAAIRSGRGKRRA